MIRPAWVTLDDADRFSLRFLWDDSRVEAELTADQGPLLEALEGVSIRGRMGLAVALYEWLVWRFKDLHDLQVPQQVLQSAWCGTVDPRYLRYFELERHDWLGPIAGPLWCGMTHLSFGINQGAHYEGDMDDALGFLYRLLSHVLPRPDTLDRWLEPVLARLAEHYPEVAADPLDDLFDKRLGEQLGPLVGRSVFDLSRPMNVNEDRNFLRDCFAQALAENNPFLASREDLVDLDFEGEPYVLP